ncbi:MAG: FAD-dependent oxidoreductase [Aerococcus sp.]|nr:FAD-dependent oxidoreductase [Aerococcus sp.]
MKYAVVGTSHGGYETVQTILEKEPNAEIHLYEQGTTASFLSCGIQSYLEDESKSLDDIHYATAESYEKQGVHMHIETQVIDVDGENHTITVKDGNGEHQDTYDKLFLYPGAIATPLPVDGTDLEHVYYMRGRDWADAIKKRMPEAKKVVVIGGGYIGIEAAEAYALAGKDVTVLDFLDRILPTYLDKPFTDRLEEHAKTKGMTFRGGEGVKAIKGENGAVTKVVTDKGEYEADTVIIAIGVKPNTKWLAGKVDLDEKGFIKINDHGETSVKDIYSGGDATLIPFKPAATWSPIALASNTRRQSIVAALNAMGQETIMTPINGTSGLHLFDYQFGATGLKDATADQYDGKVASHYMEAHVRPTFLKNIPEEDNIIYMQINYDAETHVVLGAQFMSKADVAGYANLVSLAIDNDYTLEKLGQADFFFQPEFNGPWHPVNTLAMAAAGQTFGSDKMLFM